MSKRLPFFTLLFQSIWLLLSLVILFETFNWYLKGGEYQRQEAKQEVVQRYVDSGVAPQLGEAAFDTMINEIVLATQRADHSTPTVTLPLSGAAIGVGFLCCSLTVFQIIKKNQSPSI